MHPTLDAVRGYMWRHAPVLLAGIALIVGANIFALIPPLILQEAVDSIGRRIDSGALAHYALMIVGLAIVAGVFQFASRYVINSVSRQIEYEMRTDLFLHFQRLDLEYFQQNKLGDLVARATNDLSAVRQMLGPGVSNLCNATVAFVLTAIAMIGIDTRLTLYSLTVMPAITVVFITLSGRIRQRFRDVQDQFGEVSARAQENFSGIRVVKAYAQEQHEAEAFNEVNREYVRRSIAYARLNSLLWPTMFFISGLALAVLLWRGGIDVITGRITIGRLVRFNTYLAALTWPMISLGWTVNLFQQGAASLSRIEEVKATQPAIQDRSPATGFHTPTAGEIEFQHVSLAYGEHEVLHDIDLHIPAGSSLAIVGPTGAGKTSLVNLIPRVYDVTTGRVLIDGIDVREMALPALRRATGYVPQETFLFSVSIAENIGFGVERLDSDQLEYALRVSQLSTDVTSFPRGAETMVGERGVTLSGGQKQRAGIARAIAKDPLILILDDALSSVDTNTEAAILRGLREMMRGRTTIMIAHRISTIKDLDQIIVLDAGRITAKGSHSELVAQRGLYAEMYRRQLLADELAASDSALLPSADSSPLNARDL